MKGRKNVRTGTGRQDAVPEYSLWTSPRSAWNTPFQFDRIIPDIEVIFETLALTEIPEDERLAAFRTPVTAEVFNQPT